LGFTPNRVAALGENVILLVNLAWSAVLYVQFLRRRRGFSDLERWQTNYLWTFAIWAATVVITFTPLFGYVCGVDGAAIPSLRGRYQNVRQQVVQGAVVAPFAGRHRVRRHYDGELELGHDERVLSAVAPREVHVVATALADPPSEAVAMAVEARRRALCP